MQTILILAANPENTAPLRLDEELREIDEGLKRASHRDRFRLSQRLAVRTRDIQRAMLEETPQIVHFSGHGEGDEGLVFEDEIGQAKLVSGQALAGLFELFTDPEEFPQPIQCVVLNGCYSQVQAEAIAEHVPYVIGMSRAIGDRAAIEFAVGFYDALGAGRSVRFAFKLGCSAIRMAGIEEHLTPVLVEGKAPVSQPNEQPVPEVKMASEGSSEASDLQTRLRLFQVLSELPNAQLEQILFVLKPPAGVVPGASAPQGERVAALVQWAEGPGGCGLSALTGMVESLVPGFDSQTMQSRGSMPRGTRVSGNKMLGKQQSIQVTQLNAQIENNWIEGEDQNIQVN